MTLQAMRYGECEGIEKEADKAKIEAKTQSKSCSVTSNMKSTDVAAMATEYSCLNTLNETQGRLGAGVVTIATQKMYTGVLACSSMVHMNMVVHG